MIANLARAAAILALLLAGVGLGAGAFILTELALAGGPTP